MKLRNKKTNWILRVLPLALALLAGGMQQAHAADAINIGVIDESELGEKFTKYRLELKALEDVAKQYDEQLRAREVLTPTEAKRFDELVNRVLKENKTRTPAENTELDALVKTGIGRQGQFTTIISKEKRTPAEEKERNEILGYKNANKDDVVALENVIVDVLRKNDDDTNKKYIDLANKMVEKIALEKKLTVVFRKEALVWFAPAIDLTNEVIERLNKQ